MTVPLVVVGAGGFGREVLDVVEAINRGASPPLFDLLGVLDARPSDLNLTRLSEREVEYLGSESDWLASGNAASYIIAIGAPRARASVQAAFLKAGLSAATLVHPDAVLGSQVTVGEGSVICGGVQISTNVTLGHHVHVNPNATIGHDAVLADFVSVNPGATVSGEVNIGALSLVGAGSVILQGLSVGESAVVGASACVVRDVPAGRTVMGVPAA
jgi:sugar O-acyltransferase (sialic acid O-acetyltransferase NeuD family)